MTKNTLGWLILAGVGVYVYYQTRQTPSTPDDSAVSFSDDPLASIGDTIVSATAGWKSVGDGPQWLPSLNAAEQAYGIPQDLLARMAYQESHFRTDIITGAKASPSGALGLMQLMPQYYDSVRVPRPFSPDDTQAQILQAAQAMAANYASTKSWPLAVAAYNAGLGAVQQAGGIPNYAETINYVNSILADVPAANA